MRIVLASSSPRRRVIMEQAGVDFEICASECEERTTAETPAAIVEELSRLKAVSIADEYPEDVLVIGADTVVSVDGVILGKPEDEADAIRMLRLISGRTHQVYTGVTLCAKNLLHTFHAKTDVAVAPLTKAEIESYVNSKEPFDKAGAYAIQGSFGQYITEIHGEYNNVVGLPIARILAECKELGIRLS